MFSCGGTVHANCAPAIFRLLYRSVVIFPPRATKSRFLLPRTSDLAQCALAKSLWCKNRSPNRVCVGAFPAWRTLLDSSNVPTSPKRFSFTIRKCHRTSQVKITSFFLFSTSILAHFEDLRVGNDVEFSIEKRRDKEVAVSVSLLPDGSVIFDDISSQLYSGILQGTGWNIFRNL